MNNQSALAIALFLLTSAASIAQGPAGSERGKSKGGALPIEGKMLPELTAFDESGTEVQLNQKLKGRHAVIVFGCLT